MMGSAKRTDLLWSMLFIRSNESLTVAVAHEDGADRAGCMMAQRAKKTRMSIAENLQVIVELTSIKHGGVHQEMCHYVQHDFAGRHGLSMRRSVRV